MIDKIRSVIQEVILSTLGHVDTYALYEGTVVDQDSSTGSLDIQLDDDRFGLGWSKIDIVWGLPGITAKVPKGTRVAVGFHEGRRDKPVVRHFLSTATETPIEISLEVSSDFKIKSDAFSVEAACVAIEGSDAIEIKAGPTGAQNWEHATSIEAVVGLIQQVLISMTTQMPGLMIGVNLAPLIPVIINQAIPLAAVAPTTLYNSAISGALALKVPDPTGQIPNVGWPKVTGA